MTFRNELERKCFEAAKRALGGGVVIEHNRTIQIERALFPEVASFKGPPSKEIDVLVAEVLDRPKIVLLVSCKFLSRRAEPAHVQEWCAVVQAMNKYSDGTLYLGLVVSPTGFTSGCEAWATSHNLGIVPPIKGRSLVFAEDTVLRMFERVLVALRTRLRLRSDDFGSAPAFFDFVCRFVADFEGHEEATAGGRYFVMPKGWVSSFGEMYSAVGGGLIEDLRAVEDGTVMMLVGGSALRFNGARVEFGEYSSTDASTAATARCGKNLDMEPCTLEFIKSLVVGKAVTSAADFGDFVEFGLDRRLNLGLHRLGFHLISTEEPIEDHRL